MTPEKPSPSDTSVVEPTLDFEVMRAQLVNAAFMACHLFEKHNEGISLQARLLRVSEEAVVFRLEATGQASRVYALRLFRPDGTRANLARFDEDGKAVDMELFDRAFTQACAASLPSTVGLAYAHMAPLAKEPTHAGTDTLQ